jgi:hypothetical protein
MREAHWRAMAGVAAMREWGRCRVATAARDHDVTGVESNGAHMAGRMYVTETQQ